MTIELYALGGRYPYVRRPFFREHVVMKIRRLEGRLELRIDDLLCDEVWMESSLPLVALQELLKEDPDHET